MSAVLPRRAALGLFGLPVLPRFAIAQSDTRPVITVAVQKISTSATLEPLREQSNVGQRIIASFAEGLIEQDWIDTLRPRPALAESWKRIDHQTLELTLRPGVKFHNGDPLTVEDIAFSFGNERMWSGSQAGQTGMFTSSTAGQASKAPPPEARALAAASFPGFEKIEIVDRRTIRFVNKVPDTTIEGRLTRNTGTIFSSRAFNAAPSWLEWARKPVGTGPYRIRDYRPDRDLTMDAFDEHWAGRPPIRTLRFVEVPDVAARVNGLLAGDFDFACDIPPDQIAGIEKSPRHHVLGGKIANIRILVFDKQHPQLADPRIRRALAHAIDRQAMVDSLWAGRTAVPKGMQWDFFGDMRIAEWAAPTFDPPMTRDLLKQAGYKGDPIPYQTLNNYYTNQTPSAQLIAENCQAAGLNVQIEMKENWSQILGRFPGRGFCDNSNSAWFNDPVSSMASYGPGGQTWESGQWQNPDAATALRALQTETDMDKRRAAYRRMLEICEREDPAYTVLHQNATFTAKRKDLPWRVAQSFVMDFSARNWGA
jgi:peptide/nickel transport system substrate-binding protein